MSPDTAPTLVEQAASDRGVCRAQLAENRREARAVVADRSDAQLLWRPSAKSWSVAECLLHLNRSGAIYLEAIDRAIARASLRGRPAMSPPRHPWLSRWFVGSFEPPPKRKLPAPRIFLPPPPVGPVAAIVEEFERLGAAIGTRLDASEGLDLGRVGVVSPVTPLLHLSLGMAFALLAVHERRHLYQARQVAAAPGFPPE